MSTLLTSVHASVKRYLFCRVLHFWAFNEMMNVNHWHSVWQRVFSNRQLSLLLFGYLHLNQWLPPPSRREPVSPVTSPHYPSSLSPLPSQHLCLCPLDSLQILSASPNLFYPLATFSQAVPSAWNALPALLHPKPNKSLIFFSFFKTF